MQQGGALFTPEVERLPMDAAEVDLWRAFYDPAEADALFAALLAETPWRQESIHVWGKTHPQPRLSAWYADPGTRYAYSGLRLQPLAWTPLLSAMREKLARHCGQAFNSVLLNYYRDQHDCMGWHTDDEAELGPNPVIASVSLGATRRFTFKRQATAGAAAGKPLAVELTHGSLLLMAGSTQHHWQHALPKQAAPCGARLNLTFRTVYAREAGGRT